MKIRCERIIECWVSFVNLIYESDRTVYLGASYAQLTIPLHEALAQPEYDFTIPEAFFFLRPILNALGLEHSSSIHVRSHISSIGVFIVPYLLDNFLKVASDNTESSESSLVDDPVVLLQFSTRLLDAVSESTTLNTEKYDPEFLEALLILGKTYVTIAETKQAENSKSSDLSSDLWLDTLLNATTPTEIKQGIVELDKFWEEVDAKTDLLQTETKLLKTFKLLADTKSDTLPNLKKDITNVTYLKGLMEIGKHYPQTQEAEEKDDLFYKVWRVQTQDEIQTIAASVTADNFPYREAIEGGLVDEALISQNEEVNNEEINVVENITSYWLLSTNTLYTLNDSGNGYGTVDRGMIDNQERKVIFEDLLRNNDSLDTVYFDVLAPRGAMVDSINGLENIIQNDNPNDEDDVINEFVEVANK